MSKRTWDTRWSKVLAVVSEWSEDTSSKYGAVIVDKRQRLVSTGFNGIPQGIKFEAHYHNRPDKYNYFIHAEVNAVLNSHIPVAGCTIYLLKPPCAQCAGVIINSGITQVKFLRQHDMSEIIEGQDPTNWRTSLEDAESMIHEAGIRMVQVGID